MATISEYHDKKIGGLDKYLPDWSGIRKVRTIQTEEYIFMVEMIVDGDVVLRDGPTITYSPKHERAELLYFEKNSLKSKTVL
jgi:hypothetical protein